MSGRNYSFEVTGQLEFFTDALLDALRDWCNKNKYEYATILHDKDTKQNEETKELEEVKTHRHFLVNTKSSRWTFQMLLQRFSSLGLSNQMLQNVRKGWHNALSYLVHRTDNAVKEGKHLYELSEVEANFDYIKTVDIVENEIEERRGKIDEVIEKIESLECRRFNVFQFISVADYVKRGNKQKIDMAFQYVETRLKSEKKERSMDVYWIYGKPGIGKTRLSKMLCSVNGWSYSVSSSSNDPLQDYEGEDVLILDDFRPNNWSKSDVLKMFDNNTISSIKARYQNKQTYYLKAVIVTSVQSPFEFWSAGGWEKSGVEPYEQLKRRIGLEVEMYLDEEDGHIYYNVGKYNSRGEKEVEKYDFTEQIEEEEKKNMKENEPSAFSKLKHGKKIDKYSNSIKLDTEGKFVTEKDIPF